MKIRVFKIITLSIFLVVSILTIVNDPDFSFSGNTLATDFSPEVSEGR